MRNSTRKTILFILAVFLMLALTSCSSTEEVLSAEVEKLQEDVNHLKIDISRLEAERQRLATEVTDAKIEVGEAKYVLTLHIKQTHFSLDLTEHLKDAMNDIYLQIPVDKEYYDSIDVGTVIDNSFRVGSFIWKGSFGSWRITVYDKEIM